jgi:hypothetical protein
MKYKYRGLFCGCVPIRFNFEDDGLGIDIADDWYSPVWLLDAVGAVWDFIAGCVGWDGGWHISHIKEIK